MNALSSLKARLLVVSDLEHSASLLHWDQTTYMPPGGAEARGRQIALLSKMAHEQFTDPEVGTLLDQAERETSGLPFESDEASLVRITRRLWDQEVRVPSSLVAEQREHAARSYQAWIVARPANDFESMRPEKAATGPCTGKASRT